MDKGLVGEEKAKVSLFGRVTKIGMRLKFAFLGGTAHGIIIVLGLLALCGIAMSSQ